jgi:hypothetical protein
MAVLATPWRVTCLRWAPFRQTKTPLHAMRVQGRLFFIDFRAGVLKARGAHVN